MNKTLVLFTVLSLLFLQASAQSGCDCSALPATTASRLLRTADSVAFFSVITPIKAGTDVNCQATALRYEAEYLISRKKLPSALTAIENLEKLINSSSCKDQLRMEWNLQSAGYSKATQDYEHLSQYAFKALELAESLKDKAGQFRSITYIVFLFTRQRQEEKNWDYVKRAEQLVIQLPEDDEKAIRYNWLAFEYERKYTLTQRIGLLDTALRYSQIARDAAILVPDNLQIARSYRVFESSAYNRGDIRKALLYIDTALLFLQRVEIPANPSSLYFTKAWDHMDLKEYKEAERWMDSCLYYGEKFEGRTPATMNLYKEAANLFETAGNLTHAIASYKTYSQIKDSVFNQQRLEKINELEQKYTKAKDEKTIKELAQQRSIYLLAALAFLLAAVAISFYFRQQSLKHKKNILETEQRLNRARMNPHFFFNSLTALQKYALQQKDVQAMAGSLSRFGAIMRETLESTYKEYVSIEQEMEFLQKYLEVQKVRLPASFTYRVTAASELDIEALQIPSMILQPFVENSIEHGFATIDWQAILEIRFSIEGNELCIQINDNGRGFEEGKVEQNEHISRAMQIIQDRLYLLNQKLKSKAGYKVMPNPYHRGVTVQIYLPLIYPENIKATK